MFATCSETPLPAPCAEVYRGIAFDGCRYYLTIGCECQIAVLDCDFCLVKTTKTRRPYTAICYDSKRSCFWATGQQPWATLFKLNRNLQEIDVLTVRLEGCRLGPITGVSYCCENGLLVASSGNKIVEIDQADGAARLLWEDWREALILSLVCLSPYIVFFVLRGCKMYVVLITCTGVLLAEDKKPADCVINAMLLDPCGCAPGGCGLLLLTNRHGCYPYLLRALLKEEICRGLCPCNKELCCEFEETCHPHHKNACADVMESIALQEAAIAHILKAEGEKLQKVIEVSTTPCEMLKINESVQKTIVYATHLGQVLFSRLDALRSICGFCEPELPPCLPCCDECLKDDR